MVEKKEDWRGPLKFKPIPSPSGDGHTALTIYTPDAPFMPGDTGYHCFLGGSGVVRTRTLEEAKKHLLEHAIEDCEYRVDLAMRAALHYRAQAQRLRDHGLEPA